MPTTKENRIFAHYKSVSMKCDSSDQMRIILHRTWKLPYKEINAVIHTRGRVSLEEMRKTGFIEKVKEYRIKRYNDRRSLQQKAMDADPERFKSIEEVDEYMRWCIHREGYVWGLFPNDRLPNEPRPNYYSYQS